MRETITEVPWGTTTDPFLPQTACHSFLPKLFTVNKENRFPQFGLALWKMAFEYLGGGREREVFMRREDRGKHFAGRVLISHL